MKKIQHSTYIVYSVEGFHSAQSDFAHPCVYDTNLEYPERYPALVSFHLSYNTLAKKSTVRNSSIDLSDLKGTLRETEMLHGSVEVPQRIVCAANRNRHGHIVLGIRHFDAMMHENIRNYIASCEYAKAEEIEAASDFYEQGFVDQRGNFLTRTEAWKVAEREGQIIRMVGGNSLNGGTLYTENLY